MSMFKKGKSYKTRDGREATVYATADETGRRIHGAVLAQGEWRQLSWDRGGNVWTTRSSGLDILPNTHTRYVNIYSGDHNGAMCKSREYADNIANSARIACLKLEFYEGQFDD
jgi:hypothetical protein